MASEVSRNTLMANLVARLRQDFLQALPPELDSAMINQAYRELCNGHSWYGLVRTGWLIFPGGNVGGLKGVFTEMDRVVAVSDAATFTHLQTLTNYKQQVTRMSIIGPDSRYYNIHGCWLGNDSLTATIQLDRPYFGTTTPTAQAFSTFKAYHLAPYRAVVDNLKLDPNTPPVLTASSGLAEDPTFRQFITIRPTVGSNNTSYKRMWVKETPVAIQPHLNQSNTPQALAPMGVTDVDFPGVAASGPLTPGMPIFQLTPSYSGSLNLVYECRYLTTGGELDTDNPYSVASVLPAPFTTELVLSLARVKACLWLEANKSTRVELLKTNWMQLAQQHEAVYMHERDIAMQLDRDLWSHDTNVDSNGGESWEALRPPTPDANYYGDSGMLGGYWGGGVLLENGNVLL